MFNIFNNSLNPNLVYGADRVFYVIDAVKSLRPGARFHVVDDPLTPSNLVWQDDTKTRPTDQEILDEMARLTGAWQTEYILIQRAREYPDPKEYLDGIVKGDQNQVQAYIDACLAVKAKYPKPE